MAAAVVALLLLVYPAHAHRLDEFLQATTLALQKDRVAVQVRLTPGVGVARAVLADLDADGDGTLSPNEQSADAGRMLRDLSLRVDGQPLALRLVSAAYPTVGEVREGLGEILLRFEADLPAGGSDRRLVFENHHRREISAYLVNCLVPADPDLRVTAQSRNFEQSDYQLDFVQVSPAPPAPTTAPRSNGAVFDPKKDRSAGLKASFYHRVWPFFVGGSLLGAGGVLALAAGTIWRRSKL